MLDHVVMHPQGVAWLLTFEQNAHMAWSPDPAYVGYEPVGPKVSLDRFLDEYGLTAGDVGDKITVRTLIGIDGGPGDLQYMIHEALLRSHGEFPCAGDAVALGFCREIAEEMVIAFGITRHEAVARINRQWSEPADDGRTPRVWIVGLDIAYHQTREYWARTIYYGKESYWWTGADPTPLPPPQ
jgi:hypothetical protein